MVECYDRTTSSNSERPASGGGLAQPFSTSLLALFKRLAWRWFPRQYEAHNRRKWIAKNPYAGVEEGSTSSAGVKAKLGIVKEFAHRHKYYVGACREMGVPYKVLDLSGPDWVDLVRNSRCDAFLVRPSCELSVWKRMYDERLRVMVEDLGKIVYPSYQELWFYESKRLMCYWLQAHGVPHPRTWIFYNWEEAREFARTCELPIVVKSDFGSAASGVEIMYSRSRLARYITRCFGKGVIRDGEDPRDRLWGSVVFQEYLPDAREWRVTAIGSSYFGYEKLKDGDFHSGSLLRAYGRPCDDLLSFAKGIMEEGGFTSMGLDIFETKDGRYLVNELQSLFGTSRPEMCVVDGKAGRMVFQPETQSWAFEPGDFCRNGLCNLRVQMVLAMLERCPPHGARAAGGNGSSAPVALSLNRDPETRRNPHE
ncbi:MAG: hypothetical protein QM570_06225 [Planctomycetota bacterium]|nr:hypothetical protein [Planctomycetota bacterium]